MSNTTTRAPVAKSLSTKLGECVAAPRPGAERFYRPFVDVDDANRIACVGRSRQGLLQDVEAQQAKPGHEARVGLANDTHTATTQILSTSRPF